MIENDDQKGLARGKARLQASLLDIHIICISCSWNILHQNFSNIKLESTWNICSYIQNLVYFNSLSSWAIMKIKNELETRTLDFENLLPVWNLLKLKKNGKVSVQLMRSKNNLSELWKTKCFSDSCVLERKKTEKPHLKMDSENTKRSSLRWWGWRFRNLENDNS